jgi:serine/threonine-protein kinase HipA
MMLAERQLEVTWWDGSVVGHLANRGTIYFGYSDTWLERGHNLSPLALPFTPTAFNGAKGIDGVPGLIADCLPDAWGRKVAAKEFASKRWGTPSTMALLAWRGGRGLGALRFKPALDNNGKAKKQDLETVSASALARAAAAVQRGDPVEILPQLARGGTAGGAFPKALVVKHRDGTLSVAEPMAGETACILKLETPDRLGQTACEHAYTEMAQAAGIRTVKTELLKDRENSKVQHLLVQRFDIPDINKPERRLHFHSLSGLLQREAGSLDYLDLFRAAVRLGCGRDEIKEIFRRMLFNVLASNSDDHGKNHAFAYDDSTKRWAPTPAYDVSFHSVMLERGMQIRGEVWPTVSTMREIGSELEISTSEFNALFKKIVVAIARWKEFARAADVPANLLREIGERHDRIRESVTKISKKRRPRGPSQADQPSRVKAKTNIGH